MEQGRSIDVLQGCFVRALACSFFIFLISFFNPVTASASDPGSLEANSSLEISVRLRPLVQSSSGVTVAGHDLVVSNGRDIVSQSKGFRRLTFRFIKMNSSWNISDADSDRFLVSVPERKVDVEGASLRVDLRPATPHVRLIGAPNRLDLIGVMNLETYLEGVVAGEVPGDWPAEALKAQAVAARSFTLAKAKDRRANAPPWLFEATVSDQVFDHDRVNQRASAAVRATRGEVLFSSDSQVVAANYHSDCGGTTDEPSVIWGGHPTKNGTATDSSCALNLKGGWRFVAEVTDLSNKLKSQNLLPAGFELASLTVSRRSLGGRALDIKAASASGKTTTFTGERLRQALGYGELKSTLFEIKTMSGVAKGLVGTQFEIAGRGFGHGTGLCQWGARQLALGGKSYLEILSHYYPRLSVGAEPRPRAVTLGANASP